jgi:hypothetical protein
MHIFLATPKRKVFAQLSKVPSGARHGGRFYILCSEKEGDTVQSPSIGGI